jgi:hypothetical protein
MGLHAATTADSPNFKRIETAAKRATSGAHNKDERSTELA